MMKSRFWGYGLFAALVTLFLASQIWIAQQFVRSSSNVLRDLQSASKIADEKTRQEAISLRIENERKTLFFTTFVANASAAVGVIVACSGAWLGYSQYLNMRQKERLDRAANDLNLLWQGLTSKEEVQRAGSVAGLQYFLSQDKRENHTRVVSALALVGRLENSPIVLRTLTPVVEYAMRNIDSDIVRSVSWQGLKLYKPDLSDLDLRGIDLRDCVLEDANFEKSNLSGARFDAARLNGSRFEEANLQGCNLEYADLAGCAFCGAILEGANLNNIKLQNADFDRANLKGTRLSWRELEFRLAKNWRSAQMDADVFAGLTALYGPEKSGPRILMLMWEMPNFVSGGAWTAAFHLIKNLRKRGADLVLMVPWPASMVDLSVFGNEVEIVALGIGGIEGGGSKAKGGSAYALSAYSSYSGIPGYGGSAYSVYGSGPSGQDRRAKPARLSTFSLVTEFTNKAVEAIEQKKVAFDVIHAHDWLTLQAAQRIAKLSSRPWIAHFHSIEEDRRRDRFNADIANIERSACDAAHAIVVPSAVTRKRLTSQYGEKYDAKIAVIPNCLSPEARPLAKVGEFNSSRIVFAGRLSWQKGPDIFVQIAAKVRALHPSAEFIMCGRGDEERNIVALIEQVAPQAEVARPRARDRWSDYSFENIEPIRRHPEENRIERLGPLTRAQKEDIQDRISAQGFSAVAVCFEEPYTHRIQIKKAIEGDIDEFLVEYSELLPYSVVGSKFIRLDGFVDWNDRFSMYEGASVLVVPSRSEPFGLVILEAMQCGVPVMFADACGAGEVLKEGIRFDPEDPEQAAQTLYELITDSDRWQRTADAQFQEASHYHERGSEVQLAQLWKQLGSSGATV
jgi:glycosyltransferase involved in cell wall biosynthesis/uncharacterized protein YjbI with pentapeptide repeats